MAELPIANAPDSKHRQRILVHGLRVLLFLSILVLIRFAHRETEFVDAQLVSSELAIRFVESSFSGAAEIGPFDASLNGNVVTGDAGRRIGCVLQTSPESDHFVGYSGPTNCLIVLDLENKIHSVAILNSGDTIDHVAIVKQDQPFLESFQGLGFDASSQWKEIDAVSGATLTSYAIIASIANRMNGSAPSLKFNSKPELKNVAQLFATATEIRSTDWKSIWDVFDADGNKLGFVLSTTPIADNLSGYQGPTATLAGFDAWQKCVGLVVDQTYENQPYATYLEDDYGFLDLYVGKTLEEMSQMGPEAHGIEGVSGATMTSMCVAEGLPLAAAAALSPGEPESVKPSAITRSVYSYWSDLVTVVLTLIGVSFSFTNLRHHKWFRIAFQLAVILILGFTSGHMLEVDPNYWTTGGQSLDRRTLLL